MTVPLTRVAFQQLIDEDIEVMKNMRELFVNCSGRLEWEHIIAVLEATPDRVYGKKEDTTVAQYRKKPIVIDAFQMTKERRRNNLDWPDWLHRAWNTDGGEGSLNIDEDDPKRERLVIFTKEGVYRVKWNAWIIQGIQGELYPCEPDIFEATYEAL